MLPYHLKNFPRFQQEVIIPEAQNPISFLLKPCIALPVRFFAFRCSTLAAIKLKNNLSFKAYKINDIFLVRMLTPEFEAVKTPGPYIRSEDPLGVCRRGPEIFGICNPSRCHLSITLSQPSSLEREDSSRRIIP